MLCCDVLLESIDGGDSVVFGCVVDGSVVNVLFFLYSVLFGNEKLESVDQRLEAVGERINVLSKTVADITKSR